MSFELRLGIPNINDASLREAKVYHLGLFREKVSLQPVECTISYLFMTLIFMTAVVRLFEATQSTDCGRLLSP